MEETAWDDLDAKALSSMQLSLADDVLREVVGETSAGLWLKLESLYMTKSHKPVIFEVVPLYMFRMKGGTPIKDHLDELNRIIMGP